MIGDGPLKLEPYFIETENERWDTEKARALLEKTLLFYPLGDIFYISDTRIIQSDRKPVRWSCIYQALGKHEEKICLGNPFEIISLKEEKRRTGSDVLAVIWEGGRNECLPEEENVYSNPNPITLAHELGHVLGLRHPRRLCGICSEDYRNHCSDARYIMCYSSGVKRSGFSKENIEELAEEYL